MQEEIRVALIEDHDLTRIGLQAALRKYDGIQVVGEAPDGRRGMEVLRRTMPDVAIIDIGLPDIDGITLTHQYKQMFQAASSEENPMQPKVLMLTMHNEEDAVMAAFAAGADSYSVKDASIEKLVEAIRLTYQGDCWIDPAIGQIVLRQARSRSPEQEPVPVGGRMQTIKAVSPEYEKVLECYPLTERELEVLELIVEGCSNAAIADKLYVTVGTVKTHVRNILNKLSADDRTQAAVRALRSGLVN